MKKIIMLLLCFGVRYAMATPICTRTSSYSPVAGVTHQTALLVDPSGQQTAMFDLAWGGALVSLRYNNVEYINSTSTLALVQPVLRAPSYTPVLAGDDANRGSPMIGVACSQNELWLTAGMTDYLRNQSASTAFIHNNNQWYFDHFSAPYVVSTYAYFVPNPSGSPAYYLKLDQSISNIDGLESVAFTIDLTAAPSTSYGSFRSLPAACSGSSSSCTAAGTSYLIGGYYNAPGTDGLAIATVPSSQWGSEAGTVSVEAGQIAAGNVVHLKKNGWRVPPGTGRVHSSVVMVGDWTSASAYASRACTFAVSIPFLNTSGLYTAQEGGDSALAATIPASGAATTISITAPPGCLWTALVGEGTSSSFHTSTPLGAGDVFLTPAAGSGNGTVTLNITTNPTTVFRFGSIQISGQVFPLLQQIGCAYSLSATGASMPASGGSGTVNVTAPSGSCSWRATTDASWITITSGSSGTGSGTLGYSVTANSGTARSATIVIAGLIFNVSQAAGASNCTSYSLSPPSANVAYQNGSVNVTITGSPSGCTSSWAASGNGSWITVSPLNGVGSGLVTVSWAANPATATRADTATIAGTSFPVSQNGAPLSVSGFYVLTPCRIIDTRNPNGSYGGPALAGGTVRNIVAAGICGIPSGVTSLSVNLTVVAPATAVFLALYPGPVTNPPPNVSSINVNPGQVLANNAIVGVAANGSINVYNAGGSPTHFIIDVNGYFK
jgi:hypothetical protein